MSTVCGERVAELSGAGEPSPPPPLLVDLDGTLVKTDLLIETVFSLLRQHPRCLFLLPVWLMRGRAWFKHEVARRASLDVATLPWRSEFIEALRRQRTDGRSLVLATGSDMRIARQVAEHLKLFDLVLASDGITNLCGEAKREALVNHFGEKAFDYAADGGRADRAVWKSVRQAIAVRPEPHGAANRLKALRPQHWLKNLLVFAPLIAAHRFYDIALIEKSLLAFVAFGCCASGGYLFNDLIDLEADRHHPQKRFRPLAAGDLFRSLMLC